MEVRISSLLSLILLWNSPCISSSRTERSDIYERNSQQSPETLMSQTNHLQIRPENSVHIHPGETLTLQCKDEGNEVLRQWWQTPFGLFDGCNHQNKDPVETCNGTLRILRATSSHDGLYICICQDKMSKTIVPYRVNVVGLNPNSNKQPRKTREVYANTLSESHFVAAVASSVIVSFLVAFTLGAFSRSYVIKCLRTIRAHIPYRKDDHNHINGQSNEQTTRAQPETVFFHKNHDSGEDTVDIGLADQERRNSDNVDAIGNGNADGGKDDTRDCEGEEQNQEFRSVVSPHPKKKSRVIKLYNYDEEGNRFSHIKDSGMEGEDEVRPKIRTKSLTRLNAIMKQADLNPVKDSAESQSTQPDAPSHENSVSTTEGDRVSQTSQET
ncbi:hypothetical protein ABG768_010757 [Culter alburnus]|uniref:Ig-like domain-containing protein n=1 Tax=Culter alburnus TaxID=194366 RepID=A0AAW1ZCN2_CULAL